MEKMPTTATEQTQKTVVVEAGIVLAIVLFALIPRLVYLYQIRSIPLFSNLIADGFVYDEWARRIAGGDLLGQEVFYQAPLYPYFLGLIQYFAGHNLWTMRFVQLALGAISCGLLYLVGRSFFSWTIGIASGLILSLYAPAIFYEGLIQKSALDLFLVVLLLVVIGFSLTKPGPVKWIVAGAILGLLGLTRENSLLWVPVIMIWIWISFSSFSIARRLVWSGLFLAGLCVTLLPVGARNQKVGGQFVLTTSQFGPNFYIGNSPHATGTYVPLRAGRADPLFERADAQQLAEQALGRPLTATQVSNYWLRQGWSYAQTQPMEWLSLLGKKWLMTWNFVEIVDSDDFYLYQEWSPLLNGLAQIGNFGILAPIAALGVALTWRERRRLMILYALILTMAFSVALFYVFGRYRLPLVPMLALFAGAATVQIFAVVRSRKLGLLLGSLAIAVLAWFAIHRPIAGSPGPTVAGYSNLARVFAKIGKPDEAIVNYKRALQIEPQSAEVHYNLGSLLGMRGNVQEARLHLEEAVKIQPGYAEAHSNLGNVFSMQGDPKTAVEHYRKALEIDPSFDDTRFNLGMALLYLKDFGAAAEQFQLIIKKRPDFAEGHFLLGNAYAAGGRLSEAIGEFRATLRLKPDLADGHVALARALAMTGRKDEAAQHYQRALTLLKAQRQSEAKEK